MIIRLEDLKFNWSEDKKKSPTLYNLLCTNFMKWGLLFLGFTPSFIELDLFNFIQSLIVVISFVSLDPV